MNPRRGISRMLEAFIVIVIVLIAAAIYAAFAFGLIGGTSVPAKLAISATAQSTPDGAIVTLSIQNTGTNSANIVAVLVRGATSASALSNVPVTIDVTSSTPSLSDYPNGNGLIVSGGATKTLQVLAGGTVRGSKITIYVVYYDVATGEGAIASATTIVM